MKNDDNNTKTITHLSLCSGYEGIGLGLRRVLPNLREIAYVEREGFPVANLVAKMEAGDLDAAPVFTDVKTFPYRKFRGLVDILSGGFPCQPFSNAGRREGVEDPRHLFPYIRDGIRECRPRLVFLENVEGIISSKTADGESVLQYVLRELEDLGYRATAGVFSAAEVGAPHQRKRVFILGYANSKGCQRAVSKGIQREARKPFRYRVDRKEMADSSSQRCERGEWKGPTRKEGTSNRHTTECCGSLANPNHSRGNEDRERTQLRAEGSVESPSNRWPSRPGEAQKEWEEPRVTQYSSTQVEGQAKPKLGRATNGSSARVDRLRLLGNGVVPATAAKAFVTLLNRITF